MEGQNRRNMGQIPTLICHNAQLARSDSLASHAKYTVAHTARTVERIESITSRTHRKLSKLLSNAARRKTKGKPPGGAACLIRAGSDRGAIWAFDAHSPAQILFVINAVRSQSPGSTARSLGCFYPAAQVYSTCALFRRGIV